LQYIFYPTVLSQDFTYSWCSLDVSYMLFSHPYSEGFQVQNFEVQAANNILNLLF